VACGEVDIVISGERFDDGSRTLVGTGTEARPGVEDFALGESRTKGDRTL
jgi:hypothetical protein